MRLIDADTFLKNNIEFADCEFEHPKYEDTLRDIVDNAPTIQAVPIEILDKIREETYKKAKYYHAHKQHDKADGLVLALGIIDKYREG